jgi:hypothetical protein
VVTGPGEQPLPGLAGSGQVTVIVADSQARGGRLAWTAAVSRVEPGSGEWDEVIGQLVAGRLNAVLAEGETSPAGRWARSGAVFRLAPVSSGAVPGGAGPGDAGPRDAVPGDAEPGDTAADDTAAPNSRSLLSAAPLAVHPRSRPAGHRQRRHSHQRHRHHLEVS